MRVSGSVAQKFRDGVVRINANQYTEHARLKDHVASMPGGLEAKIQEGGKQDLPSKGFPFVYVLCRCGTLDALCETRNLVTFLHPNGTLRVRYAARQWCADVAPGCDAPSPRVFSQYLLYWCGESLRERSFGGDSTSVRGWQTCIGNLCEAINFRKG